MAVDQFFKIGDIEGESRDKEHSGEIDVLAWSWGMSQSGTTHDGGGGGAGKVAVQDLSITKYVDKASINLMRACCNGKHYDEALLTVRKSGENPVEYVKMKLNEVIITSVSTGGSGGEDRLTENVTVNFAKFETIYTEQGPDGSAGAESNLVFNIAENAEG